ncbi:MAG: tetratricopeptide repeat protein, partial [Acidobacteriota bacterium]|nr:tetratricopeptide repeat protein [Acidobacteriota bacterium]
MGSRAGKYVFLALLAISCEALGVALPPLPALTFTSSFSVVRVQIKQAYDEARSKPSDAAANGKLAMVLDAYQQYAAAAVCYRRAHLLNPASFRWIYNLGYAEMKLGRYSEAATAFRAALNMNPGFLPAKLNLAESLYSAGQLKASSELFLEILQKNPENVEAHYGLGRVEAAEGNAMAAAREIERACELFPEYGGAQYALALAYRKLGQPEKAAPHFAAYQANVTTVPPAVDPLRAEVQQLDQGPLAIMRHGLDLAEGGNIEGAIQEYQRALALDPRLIQAHINLIQLYARAGENDKAEEEYHKAVSLDPNRADCYYNYGVLM